MKELQCGGPGEGGATTARPPGMRPTEVRAGSRTDGHGHIHTHGHGHRHTKLLNGVVAPLKNQTLTKSM